MRLMILTLVCFVSFQQFVFAEILKVAVTDYCPYQCVPEKEDNKIGYVSEIVRYIFERAGYSVHFEYMPYKRGIHGTERGNYDAMINVNPSHSKKLIFSKSRCGILRQNFYVRKGQQWKYAGTESLRGINVGSVIGYDYSSFNPEYESYLKKYKGDKAVQFVGGVDAPLINFRKVLKGRITTFNEDEALFEYIAAKHGFKDEFEVAGCLGENMQYVGFSPEHSETLRLIEVYDEGIKELRKSGELCSILKKYGLQDWEK